jgi:CheY-like chemotaxis protein
MDKEKRPKRVLIVDDEPNVAMVLAESLERLGEDYIVETANSGEAALARLEEQVYDLVITDYMMPDIDGLKLAESVRGIAPDTRVVLMTAYGTSELRGTVTHQKLDGYIDKPFTMSEIRTIVEKTITRASPEDPYRCERGRSKKRYTTT